MGNTHSNEDNRQSRHKPAPPSDKPEKSPSSSPRKRDKYCPYSLYIPMRQTSYNNFQSNCSTMIWHWDNIAPYNKPLKKG